MRVLVEDAQEQVRTNVAQGVKEVDEWHEERARVLRERAHELKTQIHTLGEEKQAALQAQSQGGAVVYAGLWALTAGLALAS